MKPEYSNWVPPKLKREMVCATIVFAIFTILSCLLLKGTARWIMTIILIVITYNCGWMTWWCYSTAKAFSYDGDLKFSKKIVEGTASYVSIPDGGTCLDVGCGSGALSIAVAKRHPRAKVIGCDRWGKDYDNFSKKLCERNAKAEGVSNVTFQNGNAIKLPFPDETFDVITSNYVYHNIFGKNKQDLLLESLRVLKKGGTFAIHDLMSKARYGDMNAFVKKLKDMGYEDVVLIDTTNGRFMTKKQASKYKLKGSTILYGRK